MDGKQVGLDLNEMQRRQEERTLGWAYESKIEKVNDLAEQGVCEGDNGVLECIEKPFAALEKRVGKPIDEKKQKQRFSMCQPGFSAMGWFCCCEKAKKSDLSEEVGLGISIYFKTVKQLILLFLICSILSVPQFVCLFKTEVSGEFGYQFMLGNLGTTQTIHANTTKSKDYKMVLNCSKFDNETSGLSFRLTEL